MNEYIKILLDTKDAKNKNLSRKAIEAFAKAQGLSLNRACIELLAFGIEFFDSREDLERRLSKIENILEEKNIL